MADSNLQVGTVNLFAEQIPRWHFANLRGCDERVAASLPARDKENGMGQL